MFKKKDKISAFTRKKVKETAVGDRVKWPYILKI